MCEWRVQAGRSAASPTEVGVKLPAAEEQQEEEEEEETEETEALEAVWADELDEEEEERLEAIEEVERLVEEWTCWQAATCCWLATLGPPAGCRPGPAGPRWPTREASSEPLEMVPWPESEEPQESSCRAELVWRRNEARRWLDHDDEGPPAAAFRSRHLASGPSRWLERSRSLMAAQVARGSSSSSSSSSWPSSSAVCRRGPPACPTGPVEAHSSRLLMASICRPRLVSA